MADPMEDFEAFKARYMKAGGGFTLAPWQEELVKRWGSGELVAPFRPARNSGRRLVELLVATRWEIQGRNWDAVGPRAREIRREARELAARLTDRGHHA